MSNQKSYNQLIDFLEAFTTSHYQLQNFGEGFRADINVTSTESNNFPFLYIEPLNQTIQNWVQRYRIRVYCLDLLQQDKSNRRDIMSDTLQILNDLYKHIKSETSFDYEITNNPVCTPVQNISVEGVCGWSMEIEITVTLNTNNDCDVPLGN